MRPAEEILLLLCCALGRAVQPLTPREYRQLAARFSDAPPTDGEVTASTLRAMGFSETFSARVTALLDRRGVREYCRRLPQLRIVTRLSDQFPDALRRLGDACPPALFLRGDAALLRSPCLALTGSRRLRAENARFARDIGALAAREGRTLVSGNAYGADRTGQDACRRLGGQVICFIPDALCDIPPQEDVLFCSDEGIDCPFTAARALRRNLYIYALGRTAFVAQCTAGHGGSWSGATESLRRGLSEVFVFDDGSPDAAALAREGARPLTAAPHSLAALPPAPLSIFD